MLRPFQSTAVSWSNLVWIILSIHQWINKRLALENSNLHALLLVCLIQSIHHFINSNLSLSQKYWLCTGTSQVHFTNNLHHLARRIPMYLPSCSKEACLMQILKFALQLVKCKDNPLHYQRSLTIRRHIRSVVTVICTVWGHEKYFRWQMTNIFFIFIYPAWGKTWKNI